MMELYVRMQASGVPAEVMIWKLDRLRVWADETEAINKRLAHRSGRGML